MNQFIENQIHQGIIKQMDPTDNFPGNGHHLFRNKNGRCCNIEKKSKPRYQSGDFVASVTETNFKLRPMKLERHDSMDLNRNRCSYHTYDDHDGGDKMENEKNANNERENTTKRCKPRYQSGDAVASITAKNVSLLQSILEKHDSMELNPNRFCNLSSSRGCDKIEDDYDYEEEQNQIMKRTKRRYQSGNTIASITKESFHNYRKKIVDRKDSMDMNRSRLSTLKLVYHDDEIGEATTEEGYGNMNKTNMRRSKSGAAIPSINEVDLYHQPEIFEKYDSMDLNRNRLIDLPLNARDEIVQYEARDQNKMGFETYDQSGRKNNYS